MLNLSTRCIQREQNAQLDVTQLTSVIKYSIMPIYCCLNFNSAEDSDQNTLVQNARKSSTQKTRVRALKVTYYTFNLQQKMFYIMY